MNPNNFDITALRCEYLVAPLGIDERAPRLSWTVESDRRGARQIAYRIRVASTPEKLFSGESDLWDSGRIEGNQTTHVVYAGKSLHSRDVCHWAVEAWDETGNSAISDPSFWTMGLLNKSDWCAKWITADPEVIERDSDAIMPTLTECGTPILFRREFRLSKAVRRATVYASALGVFELRFNGQKVGEDFLAPEWTDYAQRVHYRSYDISSQLKDGDNVIAATLGDGWWSGYIGYQETRARYGSLENSLMIQLEIELTDGQIITVSTDGNWTCNTGPILSSDTQMGEVYDARRERSGWDLPGQFEDWLPARETATPQALLVAQRSEPVRVVQTMPPLSERELRPGTRLFDLGQNISGWLKLELTDVPAGTRLTLRHGERLDANGELYTDNLRRAKSIDVYISSGDTNEVFQPHFTFHGFQYFEIVADPPLPANATLKATAQVVYSALAPAGSFECSHADVNRLWQNGLWSQRGNFLSIPTDCPQRDERLGWTGDAQVFLRTALYNMDSAAFFTKWMIDVEDAQTPEGIFPDTAPRIEETEPWFQLDGLCGGAGWADAGVIVPWTIWKVYGDRRIIERHWQAMVAWLNYLDKTNPRGIRENELGNNYGDWLCIPIDGTFGTPSPMKTLLATAYWADDAAKMARMAKELGKTEEAQRFQKMFEKVRAAFQQEWVEPNGRITTDTQTGYLLALAFDLLPEELRPAAAEHLVDNIRALDWHLSTGFIGVSHLNPILTVTGHADVAYRLLLQESYPSWLYPVKQGATTIWERWNGWTEKDGFFHPHNNSFNHYSLGSVGEWLFRHVAGIELDPDEPGFQKFVLRPFVGDGLDFARASYRTMHGEIISDWKRDGNVLTWSIRIPTNTTATVFIPSRADSKVSEGNTPIEKASSLRVSHREGNFLVCDASSGIYTFTSTL